MTEHILDHQARMLARYGQQFQELKIHQDWAYVLGRQVQALEDAIQDLATNRWLDATDARLDQLGHLLDEPRAGFSDADYKARLTAKIMVLRSSGSAADILRIFKQLLPNNTIKFTQFGGAGFVLSVGIVDTALLDIYSRFLRQSKSGGIDAQAVFETSGTDLFLTDAGSLLSAGTAISAVSLPVLDSADFAAGDLACVDPGTAIAEVRLVSALAVGPALTVAAMVSAHAAGTAVSRLGPATQYALMTTSRSIGDTVLTFAGGHPFAAGQDIELEPLTALEETRTILSTTSTTVTVTLALASNHTANVYAIRRITQGWSDVDSPTLGGQLTSVI